MKTGSLFLLMVLLITTLACGASAPSTTVAATLQPFIASTLTPVLPPDPTAAPGLSQMLTLRSTPFNESGTAPAYTITAQIPVLQGSDDSRVTALNTRLDQIVQTEIDQFKNDVLSFVSNPPISAGSSFDLQYSVIGQRADIWSIKFNIMFYSDGAAHPSHYSITINYDLENGRELTLDELFLPASNYLQTISDICKAQLSTRDIGFESFSKGADPLPENYQLWNISNDGLVITFDEYQVAAYAAGPQVVVIPFSALQTIVNPQSVLGLFAQ